MASPVGRACWAEILGGHKYRYLASLAPGLARVAQSVAIPVVCVSGAAPASPLYDSFCFPPTTKPLRLSSSPPAKNVLLLLSRGLVPPPVARRGPSSKHSKGRGFGRERWQNWFLPWQKSGARSSFLFLSLRTRPCRRFKAAMRPAQPLLDASPSLLFCLSHVRRNPKGLHARCGRGCIAVITHWI